MYVCVIVYIDISFNIYVYLCHVVSLYFRSCHVADSLCPCRVVSCHVPCLLSSCIKRRVRWVLFLIFHLFGSIASILIRTNAESMTRPLYYLWVYFLILGHLVDISRCHSCNQYKYRMLLVTQLGE